MRKNYELVFLTNLSSFYKINLYNEIAKRKKIYVIFISNSSKNRDSDFFKGEKNFEYIYLDNGIYENRNSLKTSLKLIKILKNINYARIALGGWDSLENWTAWAITSKRKNAVVVESSEFESITTGIKGLLKKIFVSKLSLGFASGEAQINLLRNVGFKGEIRKTKGVGIFNNTNTNTNTNTNKEIKKFLYVGRLSSEKNIEQIIRIFNNKINLELNIVGYGPLEESLKKIAKNNIKFLGKIENKKLNEIYQNNDIFILPSKSEPWGLVVEEALYNKLPVILSNKVGCSTEVIENKVHGYIYNVDSEEELIQCIDNCLDLDTYIYLKSNIEKIDFNQIKIEQIKSYI